MNFLFVTDYKTTEIGKILISEMEERMTSAGESCSSVMLEKKDNFAASLPFFLDYPADVVVTADMAGSLAINEQGETVFNSMYCRCYHILTREPWQYHVGLVRRMNFNACVVTAHPFEAAYIERLYENVPDTLVVPELEQTRQMRMEDAAKIKKRLEQLPKVFEAMAKQLMTEWKPGCILPEEIVRYLQQVKVPWNEEELLGLTVMLKDLPELYKPPMPVGTGKNQCTEELITSIISLIRAG